MNNVDKVLCAKLRIMVKNLSDVDGDIATYAAERIEALSAEIEQLENEIAGEDL